MNVIIALLLLILMMVIGMPVPLAFLSSAAYLCFANGASTQMMMIYGYNSVNTVLLLTIPLFVLAGSIMDKGGIGEKMVGAIGKLVGKVKGGLGVVTVVCCGVFGAVSGSSSATLSCIGSIMTPRLKENGYSEGVIGALLASSGVLGVLIPPSMIQILYAWSSGSSVLACFLATVVPGVLLIVLFSVINLIWAKKNPNIKLYDSMVQNVKIGEEAKPGKRKRGGQSAIPALLMPVIILGSIYGGFLTATEAAALSVIYAIPVGIFYYKKINVKTFKEALVAAGKTGGVIMAMLFSVQILSHLYITENLPDMILGVLTSISSNKNVILLMLNVFIIILGMLMDDCSCTILATPILLPIVAALGVSPIQFAAIMGVNVGMANVTPPTAPLLYLSGRISGAEVKDMLKPTLQLIVFAWIPVLILVTYFPQFALFLPRLFGYA